MDINCLKIPICVRTSKIEMTPEAMSTILALVGACCTDARLYTLLVVMGATMGTGTFKPEKNLEFFRLKSPGTHR